MTEPRSSMPSACSPNEELSRFELQSRPPYGRGDVMAMLASEALSRVATRLRGETIEATPTSQIDRLCWALISQDASQAGRLISRIRSDGMGVDIICQDLLGEAARQLGAWWLQDIIPSASVTIGCCRIYSVLHKLEDERTSLMVPPYIAGSAVFAAVPGEQHTLGVTMAAEIFRRRGWAIELLVGHTQDELLERFSARDRCIIGLSASGMRSYRSLAGVMGAIRQDCHGAQVMACGQVVTDAPCQVNLLLPDATATDLATAISGMEAMVTGRPLRLGQSLI